MEPGEIYHAKLPSGKLLPVVVVSRGEMNLGDSILCVVTTTYRFDMRKDLANCVPIAKDTFEMPEDCVAQCNNILLIERGVMDEKNGPIGKVDKKTHRRIIKAIGFVIDAN